VPNLTDDFFQRLSRPWLGEAVFDAVPDCVYFVKDDQARYIAVNRTLVERCGCSGKEELIGRTAAEVLPLPLGERFLKQDQKILSSGKPVHGQLELHIYPGGTQGWCLTWKEPLLDEVGSVIGLAGISRDLPVQKESSQFEDLSEVLREIDKHLDQALTVKFLAGKSGLSPFQLDQRIRSLFGMTTSQYIIRRKIDRACHLLERTDEMLSSIALECGYRDQSAFTRQFRQSVGMPPGAYRESRGGH